MICYGFQEDSLNRVKSHEELTISQIPITCNVLGKQIPRTPPSGCSSQNTTANSATGDTSTNPSEDGRISSFYSPSPAIRSRGVSRVRNVHIAPEDFDTPPLPVQPTVTSSTFESPVAGDKVLEAPGRFVSRDMLARTPVGHTVTHENLDSSLPPPPPVGATEPDTNNDDDRVITPDFHPPPADDNPDEVGDDQTNDDAAETPDIR